MPFKVITHASPTVIEVVYPASPSSDDVDDYVREIHRVMDAQKGPWACLVDQRNLKVIAPEYVERIARLNSYAQAKGMVRSARVVSTAVAGLQTSRIARTASLQVEVRSFADREVAMGWLTEGMPSASSTSGRPPRRAPSG